MLRWQRPFQCCIQCRTLLPNHRVFCAELQLQWVDRLKNTRTCGFPSPLSHFSHSPEDSVIRERGHSASGFLNTHIVKTLQLHPDCGSTRPHLSSRVWWQWTFVTAPVLFMCKPAPTEQHCIEQTSTQVVPVVWFECCFEPKCHFTESFTHQLPHFWPYPPTFTAEIH